MPLTRMLSRGLFLAALAASTALVTPRARAQFGYGYGGFQYQTPAEVKMLDQRALMLGGKATMGPVQNRAYANDPNAYVNHLHDDGFLDKYDVGSRRSIEATIGRYSDGPPPESQHARPAPRAMAPPSLPLSSFFDRYQKLVWPAEAPLYGELAAKKAESDQACLAVLNEYNLRGLANTSTVADARTKLIAYGRPALQYIRDNQTPRIADTFHLFMMSLYESLAQAATVPNPAAPAPPTQP